MGQQNIGGGQLQQQQQQRENQKMRRGGGDGGGGRAEGNTTNKRERRRRDKDDAFSSAATAAGGGYFPSHGGKPHRNSSGGLLTTPPPSERGGQTTFSPMQSPSHSDRSHTKQQGLAGPKDYSSSQSDHGTGSGLHSGLFGAPSASLKPSILNPVEFPSLSAPSPAGGGALPGPSSSVDGLGHQKSPPERVSQETEGFWERPPRPPPAEPMPVLPPTTTMGPSVHTEAGGRESSFTALNLPTSSHLVDSSVTAAPDSETRNSTDSKALAQKELDEKAKLPRRKRGKGKEVDPKLLGFVARHRGAT